jgi:large subunit ribosomal protein L4
MKATLLDKTGKKAEEINLKKSLFGVSGSEDSLVQYLRVYGTNRRTGNSSTKTRSEVSGSGAKPWAQKGTGRARVGTKRNPIWTHGGVAHGPKTKSWNLKLPKKVVALALRTALSGKASAGGVLVASKFEMKKPSTKEILSFLKTAEAGKKVLFILSESHEAIVKSIRNIPNVRVKTVPFLNAYDVVWCDSLIFFEDALKKLEERFKEEKK